MHTDNKLCPEEIEKRSEESKRIQEAELLLAKFQSQFTVPLTTMLATVSTFSREIGDNPTREQERYLSVIAQSCYQMLRMVDETKNYIKLRFGALSPVLRYEDLVSFLGDIVSTSRIHLQSLGLDAKLKTGLRTCPAAIDSELAEKMFLFLLAHSAKVAPRGTTLSITLSSDDDFVYISVPFSGSLLDEKALQEIIRRAADKQPDLDPRAPLGIDLAAAAGIAESHGGSLEITSECITAKLKRRSAAVLNSPISKYHSGLSPVLLALSDLLPPSHYSPFSSIHRVSSSVSPAEDDDLTVF